MKDNSSFLFRGICLGNALLTLTIIYIIIMDVALYFRIKDYPIRNDGNGTEYGGSYCEFSPLCYVTIKGVMLDQINLYIISPFVSIFDAIFRISDFSLITPNMISVFHVLIAVIAGKCISSHILSNRRIGVVLFQIRTMLDGLDGHVARTRKHIHGEGSEVGSTGYIVDGVCDALGITFLMIGLFIFLKSNPSRREYIPLQTVVMDKSDFSENHRKKLINKRLCQTMGCIIVQMILSSFAWNRYIAIYQDLLERPNVSHAIEMKELITFRSNYFLFIAFLWRVFNIHSYLHLILLAIVYDKVWELFKNIMYLGFAVLLAIICLTEMHVLLVNEIIYGNVLSYTNSTAY